MEAINTTTRGLERVDNKVFYHISRYRGGMHEQIFGKWQVGEKRIIGEGKNAQTLMFDRQQYVTIDPHTNNYVPYTLLFDRMKEFIQTGKRDQYFDFHHFDPSKTVLEIDVILRVYIYMVREFIFEEVRARQFPHLPSRQKCLWVIDDTPQALDYWVNKADLTKINPDSDMVKFRLTGDIFRSSEEYLPIVGLTLDEWRRLALLYWSAVPPMHEDPNSIECTFVGTAEVLEITHLDQFKSSLNRGEIQMPAS